MSQDFEPRRSIYLEEVDPPTPAELTPLQQYIDRLPSTAEEALQDAAQRAASGDAGAISEFVEVALPDIRETVRQYNQELGLDEDEIINMAAAGVIARFHQITTNYYDYRMSLKPRLRRYVREIIEAGLYNYTAYAAVDRVGLDKIRSLANNAMGEDGKQSAIPNVLNTINIDQVNANGDADPEQEAEIDQVVSRLGAAQELEWLRTQNERRITRRSTRPAEDLAGFWINLATALAYYGGEPMAEIANRLGVSYGRVDQRRNKCLVALSKAATAGTEILGRENRTRLLY